MAGADVPSFKRQRRDYETTINVLAGKEERLFVVHRETMCDGSPFFAPACKKEWAEGKEELVRLPEHDADAFQVYVHWMYTRQLDMTLMEEPSESCRGDANAQLRPSYWNLATVWTLGAFLMDSNLCNVIVDAWLLKTDQLPTNGILPVTINYVWEHTEEASMLRRLCTDLTLARANENLNAEELPLEILVSIARRYRADLGKPSGPTYQERERYYVQE